MQDLVDRAKQEQDRCCLHGQYGQSEEQDETCVERRSWFLEIAGETKESGQGKHGHGGVEDTSHPEDGLVIEEVCEELTR